MSLHIGDLRQYSDENRTTFIQWEVTDTTNRIDGQNVYKVLETIFIDHDIYKSFHYYFIKDSFFIETELDTISIGTSFRIKQLNKKKYNEQRLAKIYPKDGDYFAKRIDVSDSEKSFFKIHLLESMEFPCGRIKNIARYESIDTDTTSNQFIFYSPIFGHVGSIFESTRGVGKMFATYIRVDKQEIGNYSELKKILTKQLY
jgi:hypothetical protein